jgi:hypothetical protein
MPSLEMGIYVVGGLEVAELFANEDEFVRKHLIEARDLHRERHGRIARTSGQSEAPGQSVSTRPPASTSRPITTTSTTSFDLGALGLNFRWPRSRSVTMDIDPDLFADYARELSEAA